LAHDLFQQAELIVGVQNGEIPREPEKICVTAEEPDADRVKGAELDLARDRADEGGGTLLHLGRGLICKGDGEYLPRAHRAEVQDMRKARDQHPRLAGACACEHENGSVERLHRGPLPLVQGVKIGEIVIACRRGARIEIANVKAVRHGSRYSPSAGGRLLLIRDLFTAFIAAERDSPSPSRALPACRWR